MHLKHSQLTCYMNEHFQTRLCQFFVIPVSNIDVEIMNLKRTLLMFVHGKYWGQGK